VNCHVPPVVGGARLTGPLHPVRTRVLQITSELGIGGLERVVETLARTMDPGRFEPAVVCLRELGPFAPRLEALGIPVHLIRADPRRTDRLAFLTLARIIREWRPDVVHTHNTEPLLDGALASLFARVPTLVHTDHARAFPDRWRYMLAERIAAIKAYRIVGVSDDSTANLRRFLRIPEHKLATVENGVDAAPFLSAPDRATARRSLGCEPDAPVIGLAARLEDQKGIGFLLEAMPAVLRAHPGCRVLIAGVGSRGEALRAQATHLGLDGRVRFLGEWHEVPTLLRALDLFVIPSVWEGLPMALLESMAARCPVISTSVGGIPGVLVHDTSGWLVPPREVAPLAEGIIHLLADAPSRWRLADAAFSTFEQRYSAATMTRRYEALYRREPELAGRVTQERGSVSRAVVGGTLVPCSAAS
jgi:glycosyltransferase involved in cell wall biosynthesis